jgi:hypothetical protein
LDNSFTCSDFNFNLGENKNSIIWGNFKFKNFSLYKLEIVHWQFILYARHFGKTTFDLQYLSLWMMFLQDNWLEFTMAVKRNGDLLLLVLSCIAFLVLAIVAIDRLLFLFIVLLVNAFPFHLLASLSKSRQTVLLARFCASCADTNLFSCINSWAATLSIIPSIIPTFRI